MECKISVDETNVLSVVVPRVILMLLERERMKSVHILPVVSFNFKRIIATIISHFDFYNDNQIFMNKFVYLF